MSSSRDPSLARVLTQALTRHSDSLRVAMPGRVEGFDAATQTADVLPLQRQTDSVDGSDVATAFPVLPAVPVAFAGGGGLSLIHI